MKLFFITIFAFFISVQSHSRVLQYTNFASGPISSGGGMGVVCYSPEGKIHSVELLDLWEAKTLHDLSPIYSDKRSVEEIINSSLQSLKNSIDASGYGSSNDKGEMEYGPESLLKHLKRDTDRLVSNQPISSIKRLRGVELTLTDDAFEVIRPIDCKIKQLIRYTDKIGQGDILINQDLVDKMSPVHVAALYLHEAYYAVLRSAGEQSSIRVRRTIGQVLSGLNFNEWHQDHYAESVYTCSNYQSKFYVYIYEGEDYMSISYRISRLAGRPMIGWVQRSARLLRSLTAKDIFRSPLLGTMDRSISRDFSFIIDFYNKLGGYENVSARLSVFTSPDQNGSFNDNEMICTKEEL